MNWIQHYLCSLAWRILWRWWPDRVYLAALKADRDDLDHPWVVMEAGTPSHPHVEIVNNAFLVFEKIDHAGKVVKNRG